MGKRSFVHLNNHQMCAVDCETTGLDPDVNEIIQLAIIPIDADLKPIKNLKHLDLWIKPLYPERIDAEIRRSRNFRTKIESAIEYGLSWDQALEAFEFWFESLQLLPNKRVIPLAHNWIFDSSFIRSFIGRELFNFTFDSRARDTLTIANYLNDRRDFDGGTIPFPKSLTLESIAKRLGVEVDRKSLHNALYDCQLTIQVYTALMKERFDDIV